MESTPSETVSSPFTGLINSKAKAKCNNIEHDKQSPFAFQYPVFYGNSADIGGAVYFPTSAMQKNAIKFGPSATFNYNTASTFGAAIFLHISSASLPVKVGCSISY